MGKKQANAAMEDAANSANSKLEQVSNQGIVQKWGFDDLKKQAGDAQTQANSAVSDAQVQAAEAKKQANAAMEDAANSANSKLEQVSNQGISQKWGFGDLKKQAGDAQTQANS